jgi:ribonuclease BN (tRNA processing enzyme)
VKVLIVGVGDAFTRKHFGSSAVVRAPGGGFVLIDCSDLIHRALHEANRASGWPVDVAAIDDIIITHLHGDHCNGLESFGFYRRIARMKDAKMVRPRLHVTQPVAERVWQKLAPAMDGSMGSATSSRLEDYFDVRVLDPAKPATIAGLSVRCRFTKHPVPTVGLLLSDGSTIFGWSADTPFEKAHIDWLAQADVFVHESNQGVSHTPIESLNALDCGIKRKMRLIHLPDDFDPMTTGMAILREGEVLAIGE